MLAVPILPLLFLLLTALNLRAAEPATTTHDLVSRASDPNLAETERKAAFENARQVGDVSSLMILSRDPQADARKRWVSIRLLGKVNSALAVECLLGLLKDEVPGMRAAAAMALGDTHRADVSEKVAGMLEDPAIIVRAAAADSLGSFRDPRTVPYLVQAIEDPTNTYRGSSLWVRRHFVDALGAIGDKSANRTLMQLIDDPDASIQTSAISALDRVNGISWSDGRTQDEQKIAWKRWWLNQERTRGSDGR